MSDELSENINTLLCKCVNSKSLDDIQLLLMHFIETNSEELSEQGIWEDISTQIEQFINFRKQTGRYSPFQYTPLNDDMGYFRLLYSLYKAKNNSFSIE